MARIYLLKSVEKNIWDSEAKPTQEAPAVAFMLTALAAAAVCTTFIDFLLLSFLCGVFRAAHYHLTSLVLRRFFL